MTKRFLFSASLAALALASAPRLAAAQQLDLPRPSPTVKLTQAVGLTDITVEYSSPGVKGRKIWGGLVPYDQVWRTGANLATKITFSKDVVVGDKAIPAGTYALFSIPGKTSWTVILNKNFNQAGTDQYDQALDVARLQVTPKAMPAARERLTFIFSDTSDSGASLDLEWEKLRLAIPVKVKTEEQVQAAITGMVNNAWRPYTNAARYLLEVKKYDQGLELVDRSIALQETALNVWTKAQLLAGQGKYRDAYPLAEKAQQLGQKIQGGFFFDEDIKKALVEWKKK